VNRNRRLFIIVFIVFTAIVILFTIDMARRTTAPWNKKREVERALPNKQAGTAIDTTVTDDDTLLAPK